MEHKSDITISNVEVIEQSFFKEGKRVEEKEQQEKFNECVSYAEKAGYNLHDILPRNSKYTIRFDIINANTDLANAIRRCMIDEVEVISLTFDSSDLLIHERNHDEFILPEYLKKNIEAVPISQDLDYNRVSIELDVENKTDEIRNVYTGDILFRDASGREIENSNIFSTNICIAKLRPGKRLRVAKMQLVKGKCLDDSNKFRLTQSEYYEILDVKPLLVEKYGKIEGKSSLEVNPSSFRIGFSTYRNIDPKNVIDKVCDSLIGRLDKIRRGLESIQIVDSGNITLSNFSEEISIELVGDVYHVIIDDEYWTMGNLISRYCYILDPENIAFVCPSIEHTQVERAIIKIKHPQVKEILIDAIAKAVADLSNIKILLHEKIENIITSERKKESKEEKEREKKEERKKEERKKEEKKKKRKREKEEEKKKEKKILRKQKKEVEKHIEKEEKKKKKEI
jgi:hypothetical protein